MLNRKNFVTEASEKGVNINKIFLKHGYGVFLCNGVLRLKFRFKNNFLISGGTIYINGGGTTSNNSFFIRYFSTINRQKILCESTIQFNTFFLLFIYRFLQLNSFKQKVLLNKVIDKEKSNIFSENEMSVLLKDLGLYNVIKSDDFFTISLNLLVKSIKNENFELFIENESNDALLFILFKEVFIYFMKETGYSKKFILPFIFENGNTNNKDFLYSKINLYLENNKSILLKIKNIKNFANILFQLYRVNHSDNSMVLIKKNYALDLELLDNFIFIYGIMDNASLLKILEKNETENLHEDSLFFFLKNNLLYLNFEKYKNFFFSNRNNIQFFLKNFFYNVLWFKPKNRHYSSDLLKENITALKNINFSDKNANNNLDLFLSFNNQIELEKEKNLFLMKFKKFIYASDTGNFFFEIFVEKKEKKTDFFSLFSLYNEKDIDANLFYEEPGKNISNSFYRNKNIKIQFKNLKGDLDGKYNFFFNFSLNFSSKNKVSNFFEFYKNFFLHYNEQYWNSLFFIETFGKFKNTYRPNKEKGRNRTKDLKEQDRLDNFEVNHSNIDIDEKLTINYGFMKQFETGYKQREFEFYWQKKYLDKNFLFLPNVSKTFFVDKKKKIIFAQVFESNLKRFDNVYLRSLKVQFPFIKDNSIYTEDSFVLEDKRISNVNYMTSEFLDELLGTESSNLNHFLNILKIAPVYKDLLIRKKDYISFSHLLTNSFGSFGLKRFIKSSSNANVSSIRSDVNFQKNVINIIDQKYLVKRALAHDFLSEKVGVNYIEGLRNKKLDDLTENKFFKVLQLTTPFSYLKKRFSFGNNVLNSKMNYTPSFFSSADNYNNSLFFLLSDTVSTTFANDLLNFDAFKVPSVNLQKNFADFMMLNLLNRLKYDRYFFEQKMNNLSDVIIIPYSLLYSKYVISNVNVNVNMSTDLGVLDIKDILRNDEFVVMFPFMNRRKWSITSNIFLNNDRAQLLRRRSSPYSFEKKDVFFENWKDLFENEDFRFKLKFEKWSYFFKLINKNFIDKTNLMQFFVNDGKSLFLRNYLSNYIENDKDHKNFLYNFNNIWWENYSYLVRDYLYDFHDFTSIFDLQYRRVKLLNSGILQLLYTTPKKSLFLASQNLKKSLQELNKNGLKNFDLIYPVTQQKLHFDLQLNKISLDNFSLFSFLKTTPKSEIKQKIITKGLKRLIRDKSLNNRKFLSRNLNLHKVKFLEKNLIYKKNKIRTFLNRNSVRFFWHTIRWLDGKRELKERLVRPSFLNDTNQEKKKRLIWKIIAENVKGGLEAEDMVKDSSKENLKSGVRFDFKKKRGLVRVFFNLNKKNPIKRNEFTTSYRGFIHKKTLDANVDWRMLKPEKDLQKTILEHWFNLFPYGPENFVESLNSLNLQSDYWQAHQIYNYEAGLENIDDARLDVFEQLKKYQTKHKYKPFKRYKLISNSELLYDSVELKRNDRRFLEPLYNSKRFARQKWYKDHSYLYANNSQNEVNPFDIKTAAGLTLKHNNRFVLQDKFSKSFVLPYDVEENQDEVFIPKSFFLADEMLSNMNMSPNWKPRIRDHLWFRLFNDKNRYKSINFLNHKHNSFFGSSVGKHRLMLRDFVFNQKIKHNRRKMLLIMKKFQRMFLNKNKENFFYNNFFENEKFSNKYFKNLNLYSIDIWKNPIHVSDFKFILGLNYFRNRRDGSLLLEFVKYMKKSVEEEKEKKKENYLWRKKFFRRHYNTNLDEWKWAHFWSRFKHEKFKKNFYENNLSSLYGDILFEQHFMFQENLKLYDKRLSSYKENLSVNWNLYADKYHNHKYINIIKKIPFIFKKESKNLFENGKTNFDSKKFLEKNLKINSDISQLDLNFFQSYSQNIDNSRLFDLLDISFDSKKTMNQYWINFDFWYFIYDFRINFPEFYLFFLNFDLNSFFLRTEMFDEKRNLDYLEIWESIAYNEHKNIFYLRNFAKYKEVFMPKIFDFKEKEIKDRYILSNYFKEKISFKHELKSSLIKRWTKRLKRQYFRSFSYSKLRPKIKKVWQKKADRQFSLNKGNNKFLHNSIFSDKGWNLSSLFDLYNLNERDVDSIEKSFLIQFNHEFAYKDKEKIFSFIQNLNEEKKNLYIKILIDFFSKYSTVSMLDFSKNYLDLDNLELDNSEFDVIDKNEKTSSEDFFIVSELTDYSDDDSVDVIPTESNDFNELVDIDSAEGTFDFLLSTLEESSTVEFSDLFNDVNLHINKSKNFEFYSILNKYVTAHNFKTEKIDEKTNEYLFFIFNRLNYFDLFNQLSKFEDNREDELSYGMMFKYWWYGWSLWPEFNEDFLYKREGNLEYFEENEIFKNNEMISKYFSLIMPRQLKNKENLKSIYDLIFLKKMNKDDADISFSKIKLKNKWFRKGNFLFSSFDLKGLTNKVSFNYFEKNLNYKNFILDGNRSNLLYNKFDNFLYWELGFFNYFDYNNIIWTQKFNKDLVSFFNNLKKDSSLNLLNNDILLNIIDYSTISSELKTLQRLTLLDFDLKKKEYLVNELILVSFLNLFKKNFVLEYKFFDKVDFKDKIPFGSLNSLFENRIFGLNSNNSLIGESIFFENDSKNILELKGLNFSKITGASTLEPNISFDLLIFKNSSFFKTKYHDLWWKQFFVNWESIWRELSYLDKKPLDGQEKKKKFVWQNFFRVDSQFFKVPKKLKAEKILNDVNIDLFSVHPYVLHFLNDIKNYSAYSRFVDSVEPTQKWPFFIHRNYYDPWDSEIVMWTGVSRKIHRIYFNSWMDSLDKRRYAHKTWRFQRRLRYGRNYMKKTIRQAKYNWDSMKYSFVKVLNSLMGFPLIKGPKPTDVLQKMPHDFFFASPIFTVNHIDMKIPYLNHMVFSPWYTQLFDQKGNLEFLLLHQNSLSRKKKQNWYFSKRKNYVFKNVNFDNSFVDNFGDINKFLIMPGYNYQNYNYKKPFSRNLSVNSKFTKNRYYRLRRSYVRKKFLKRMKRRLRGFKRLDLKVKKFGSLPNISKNVSRSRKQEKVSFWSFYPEFRKNLFVFEEGNSFIKKILSNLFLYSGYSYKEKELLFGPKGFFDKEYFFQNMNFKEFSNFGFERLLLSNTHKDLYSFSWKNFVFNRYPNWSTFWINKNFDENWVFTAQPVNLYGHDEKPFGQNWVYSNFFDLFKQNTWYGLYEEGIGNFIFRILEKSKNYDIDNFFGQNIEKNMIYFKEDTENSWRYSLFVFLNRFLLREDNGRGKRKRKQRFDLYNATRKKSHKSKRRSNVDLEYEYIHSFMENFDGHPDLMNYFMSTVNYGQHLAQNVIANTVNFDHYNLPSVDYYDYTNINYLQNLFIKTGTLKAEKFYHDNFINTKGLNLFFFNKNNIKGKKIEKNVIKNDFDNLVIKTIYFDTWTHFRLRYFKLIERKAWNKYKLKRLNFLFEKVKEFDYLSYENIKKNLFLKGRDRRRREPLNHQGDYKDVTRIFLPQDYPSINFSDFFNDYWVYGRELYAMTLFDRFRIKDDLYDLSLMTNDINSKVGSFDKFFHSTLHLNEQLESFYFKTIERFLSRNSLRLAKFLLKVNENFITKKFKKKLEESQKKKNGRIFSKKKRKS
jgi:hypothetical protein